MRRVGRRKARWTGWRDLGFFLHWESIAVGAGAAGLLALEWWDIPDDWPLNDFVSDYRIWIVIACAIAIGIPPTVARGFDHLRARDDAGLAQVEVATALYGIEMRLMHFVSKIREVFDGHVSNTYQNHTLSDCKTYFATRPERQRDGGSQNVVEATFYRLRRSRSSTVLERTLFTGSGHPGMRPTFSTARNASPEAKRLVKSIAAGNAVFCRDVRDPEEAAALEIVDGAARPYRTLLSVPVFKDKASPADDRVIGMLSVNATEVDSILASDQAVLNVYAWVLAAAFEADAQGRRVRGGGARIAAESTTLGRPNRGGDS